MIEELYVKGMGGIKFASLFFSGDFIAITGESGAGKSSLVRAFEFISGKRACSTAINADSREVTVEAVWSVGPAKERKKGPKDEEESLITRRTLSRSGKGRCSIHDAPATVAQLAETSSPLIEIQSQFAQLNLLDTTRQLELIDICGREEIGELKERLSNVFPEMLHTEKELLALRKRRMELEGELEGASARVRGIEALSLYPGCEREWLDELESLEKQLDKAGYMEDLFRRIGGDEGEEALLQRLETTLKDLYLAAPLELKENWERLGEAALSDLQQLFESARSELCILSKEELASCYERIEEKTGLLRRLKREVAAASDADLLSYVERVKSEMQWLKSSSALLAETTKRADELKSTVANLARGLRSLREDSAVTFAAKVNEHLAGLAMEDHRFSVAVTRHDKIRANGAESVSFLLALKDLPPGPVGRVASGGELSRILIAIEASIDPSRLPGTLVLDEVEAGLGGRTALLAGETLKKLSRCCRIVLITHEATIAAMADQHFVVRRTGDLTEVFEIDGEDRVWEIARMLSGSDSPEAIEHARTLLVHNGKIKD